MSHANDAIISQSVSLTPESWGWKPEFFADWASRNSALVPARVTGREHHSYEILIPDFSRRPGFESLFAPGGSAPGGLEPGFRGDVRVSGRFEYEARERADFPAPGDWVLVDPAEDLLRVHGVLARRSSLSRAAAGPTSEEQVLAANIDTLFLVFALDGGRNFLARLLERSLFVARNSGAAPCIVLNKADLATEETRAAALAEAARLAPTVPVVALSAKTGEGIEGISALLSPGETVGMLGKSGVGKSALVNALACVGNVAAHAAGGAGSALAREGQVREDDRQGRHTTTSSRLFRLDSGILMIDSPGIRELKIWGDAEGLDEGFPEIAELAGRCRFADCSHANEPGCAVREALETGELEEARFAAWKNLRREQAYVERRSDARAAREETEKWKKIAKYQKELKKGRR